MIRLALAVVLLFPCAALATPMYAAKAGKGCATCHIEPTGWDNPALADRKCTLDCSGCHVSSTGGGMRKPAGEFFGKEDLPMLGHRPSTDGDPEKYRDEGDQTKPGRFRVWEGFSGWAEGTHPLEDVKDRFGKIDPHPGWDIGGDFRFMGYFPKDDDSAFFPMQTDVYGMYRVAPKLKLYGTAGYLGRLRREPDNLVVKFSLEEPTGEDIAEAEKDEKEVESLKTLIAMRELFVIAEDMPFSGYVRAGRFNKPHGWRVPDHTTFTRRGMGFDQNSQVFGVEAGLNPNFPYGNLAIFYQGSDDWPGDFMPKGYGAAFTGGYRGLLGQVGLSLERVRYEDLFLGEPGDQTIVGPIWAVNAWPVVYLGELDVMQMEPDIPGAETTRLMFAYHELNVDLPLGLVGILKYDWMDANIDVKDDNTDRYTLGVEWNPYTHVQLLVEWRKTYLAKEESGEDVLVMTHLWF